MRVSISALGCAIVGAISCAPLVAAPAKQQPVSITFAVTADGKEVGCGAPLANLGSGHFAAKLHEARFYVYGFKLIDAKGKRTPVALDQSEWQYGDVALLDFKDARGGNAPCAQGNPAKNTTVSRNRAGGLLRRSRILGRRAASRPSSTASSSRSIIPTSRPRRRRSISPAWHGTGRPAGVSSLSRSIPPSPVIKADGSKSRNMDGPSRLDRLQRQSGDRRDRLLRA